MILNITSSSFGSSEDTLKSCIAQNCNFNYESETIITNHSHLILVNCNLEKQVEEILLRLNFKMLSECRGRRLGDPTLKEIF